MLFRQLFDPRSSTLTYLLGDESSGEAVLIDPVYEQAPRDAALLRELGLRLRYSLETHVHADHITAAWRLRQALGSQIAAPAHGGVEGADLLLEDQQAVWFGGCRLTVRATPGHTDGCCSFITEDEASVFTGDSLMIRSAGRTDFQNGDARRLYRSVHQRLFCLPPGCLVYPAHDYAGRTCTSIAEERDLNPRLGGGRSEDDFVDTMEALGLPHPAQIDEALPANLRCGRPPGGVAPLHEWTAAVRTLAGALEVEPEWLSAHRAEVTVVDVRKATSRGLPAGRIAGSLDIPLGELRRRLDAVARDRPVVTVCRAGACSTQAQQVLEKAGYPRAASLRGGLEAWQRLGLPLD